MGGILYGVHGGDTSDYRFSVNGGRVLSAFDLLQSDTLKHGDIVGCVLENSAGCTDTLLRVMDIAPRPRVMASCLRKVTRNQPVEIKLGAYVDGTIYRWQAEGIGPIEVVTDSGTT